MMNTKIAKNIKTLAMELFEPFQSEIKNWNGFIASVITYAQDILETEEVTVKKISYDYGETIAQGGKIDDDPPDYEEISVDAPTEMHLQFYIRLKYKDIVKEWVQYALKSFLINPNQFKKDFYNKLTKDSKYQKLFSIFIKQSIIKSTSSIDSDWWVSYTKFPKDWDGYTSYNVNDVDIGGNTVKVTKVKVTSQDLQIDLLTSVDVEFDLSVDNSRYSSWNKLPKGWTQKSLHKFWNTLTGDRKHKVTACIKRMDGKIDNPGAFCASLNDKIDPGWRTRKKKASILADKWISKQAQDPVTFNHFLKPLAKLPPMILRDLKALNAKDVFSDNQGYKSYICGFIYVMLSELQMKKSSQLKQIWSLFERGGPSMSYGKNVHDLYRKYSRFFKGSGSEPWLKAIAVSIDLLRRGRLQTVMTKFEALMIREFADDLAGSTPATGKLETQNQTFIRLIQNELPEATKLIRAVGKNPKTIRAYVAEILEDVNWSSLSDKLWVESDDEINHDIVSKISMDYDFDLIYSAIFGLAALSLVKDKSGMMIIKKAIKSRFSDFLEQNSELV